MLLKFKNAFATALIPQNNMSWKTTPSGEIVTNSNIDSYLEKLEKPDAENLLQELQDIQAQVNAGTTSWNNYFKTYNGAKRYIVDFIQKTDLQKASVEDLINANKAARESAIAHNNALKQQTLGAKAATVATKVLSATLNSIAMIAIGEAISALISGIDYLIHKEEKENEALDDAQEKFNQTTQEVNSLQAQLDSTKSRISELQELANNGTISIAEENELKTLQKTNDELERKIALREKERADDAEELLRKAKTKVDNKTQYFYVRYDDEGNTHPVAKKGNAIDRLQDNLTAYQDMASHGDLTEDRFNAENFNKKVSKDAKIVGKLIDAYKSLTDAGITLTSEQQKEYNSALKAQDAYLLYSYTLEQTKERFQGLTEEQQRSIIHNKLMEKGLTMQEADSVLKNIQKEDLGEYYDFDFNFPLPDRNDFQTAEAYGQAYAEAWKKGVNNDIAIGFDKAWDALDNPEDAALQNLKDELLALAKQGKLTEESFNKTTGAKSWLNQVGLSAKETVKHINQLKEVSSVEQLASMKTGISSISDILSQKQENLSDKSTEKNGIGSDILSSMPDDIKSCTEAYENFYEVLGNGSSTMADCREAASQLANAYINSNNFLANLTSSNKECYIAELQAMGIENADIIVKSMLIQKEAELSAEKQWAKATTLDLANATYNEITALAEEQKWSDETTNALYRLALEKQIANGVSLDSLSDIDNLIALVDAIGGTTTALSAYRKLMENPSSVSTSELAEAQRKSKKEIETAREKAARSKKPVFSPKSPKIPESNNQNSSIKPEPVKESKQEIDWLSQKLTFLQDKVDMLKTKFENLFSTPKKNRNLNNQIKETSKLLTAQEKASARYQKKAGSYYNSNKKVLTKNGISLKMLQNGSYNIRSYKSSIANIIQTYEAYYDKAQDARKATLELSASIRELSKQKLEMQLDSNERKRTYLEARYANATTTDQKNKILRKEINTFPAEDKAYNNYYTRAKRFRNQAGKKAKTSVNKSKKIPESVKKKIINKIKQKKEIPKSLLKKVSNIDKYVYQKLVDYNNSVDFVTDALRDKKLAKEERISKIREKNVERHQNRADSAEARYNLYQQYEANAIDAKTKNKYEAESLNCLKKQYEHLIKIAELEGNTAEQKRLQAEEQAKIAESYKTMYDNIQAEYDNKTGINDAKIATIQAQIATLEAAGKNAAKEMYADMMESSSDTMKKLLKKRAELEKAGKRFEYYSPEWYGLQNDLLSIDQQIESCTQQTIEWQKALNALDLKKYSIIADQIASANSQIDFLTDILSHKKLTSKDAGGLTDEGLTSISLWIDKMENNKKTIENAQNAMAEYQKQIAAGTTGDDFQTQNQKMQEWIQTIRDAALADEELKESIVSLVEEAFNVQLDALNELIEKRKKALQTEKDLYDYQRKIASQTKSIANIQKQIAALTGDNSEEARAKLQKLKVNLEEAQQDLKDTEYDKWISDQEDLLDNLSEDMENFFENALQNTDSLIEAVVKTIDENGYIIADTLEKTGYGNADSFRTKENGDGTYTSTYTDYNGKQYQITTDAYGSNLGQVKSPAQPELTIESVKNSMNRSERSPHYVDKNPLLTENINGHTPDRTNASKIDKNADLSGAYLKSLNLQIKGSLSKCKSLKNQSTTFINKYTFGEYGNELNQYLAEKYGKVYTSWADMKELAKILGVKVSGKKPTSKEAKKIRDALKNAGFANGGIASVLNEAAIQNGDDGIATLQRGESVLTSEQTKQFRKFLEITPAASHIMKNATKLAQTPEITNSFTNSQNVNVGGISIHLDGSGIVDEHSFVDTFKRSTMIQSAIDESVAKGMTKAYSNTLGRF
ncbi:hypothetical protein D7V86_03355 [bacterium D16-51]|nr:hypothetical protein D7V96_00565 [bacterium D16-59]RKI61846.1 hypothetical protein D7V86_03355 [bacterium D16-51]